MDGDEDILWEGTISGKIFEYILIIVLFLGALLADIGLFFWHPEDFWMVIAKYVCIGGASFIVIIGIIGGTCEMVKGGIKFILTRDQIIYEHNSLLGRRIIETFDLDHLKTLK